MTKLDSPYQLPAGAIERVQSEEYFETRDLRLIYRLTDSFAIGDAPLVECDGRLYSAHAMQEEKLCRFRVTVSPYVAPPSTESTP